MNAILNTVLIMNFIYCSIIAIIFFVRKKSSNMETNIYKIILCCTLLSIILEIMCGYSIRNIGSENIITILINKLHIGNMCFWITLLTIYMITIAYGSEKIKSKLQRRCRRK